MRQRGSAATHHNGCRPAFEPSLEQIASACREIQSEWSESERLARWRADLPGGEKVMSDGVSKPPFTGV